MFKQWKTIEGVLGNFNKVVNDLKIIQERELGNFTFFSEKSALALTEANLAKQEADKAGVIIKNMEKLIGQH